MVKLHGFAAIRRVVASICHSNTSLSPRGLKSPAKCMILQKIGVVVADYSRDKHTCGEVIRLKQNPFVKNCSGDFGDFVATHLSEQELPRSITEKTYHRKPTQRH